MEIKAIDVASDDGLPDWGKVAAAGIKAAILRVHQKFGIDSSFEHNFTGCKNNGIAIGVYKYSYALTAEQAEQEADAVLEVLNGRGLDFPVFYDLEWNVQEQLSGDIIANIAMAFLKKVQSAGYKVGIYCSTDWYNNVLDRNMLPYDFWLASVPEEDADNGSIVERLRPDAGVGWQYSWKGTVPGITNKVDMDVFYTDYRGETQMSKGAFKAVELAETREGKNQYTQTDKREQVFSGYSDCSALWWKSFEKAYGIQIGTWTGEQVTKGTQVATFGGKAALTEEDYKKLQVGDLIYFGSGDARHVEGFVGWKNGVPMLFGHGSGTPSYKNGLTYRHSAGYYQARRYYTEIREDGSTPADTTEPATTDTSKTTIAYPARMKADTKCYLDPGGTQSTMFPLIKKEAIVDVMKHTSKDSAGNKYYFIRIPHATEGFVYEYIKSGSFQHIK